MGRGRPCHTPRPIGAIRGTGGRTLSSRTAGSRWSCLMLRSTASTTPGFRCGHYEDKNGAVAADLAFSGSWDLRRIRPHFFPRGSSVVFGSRAGQAKAMPDTTEYWSGRVPAHWAHRWPMHGNTFSA